MKSFARSFLLSLAFAAACIYFPATIAGPLNAYAAALGSKQSNAADFMLRTVPHGALATAMVAVTTAMLICIPVNVRR